MKVKRVAKIDDPASRIYGIANIISSMASRGDEHFRYDEDTFFLISDLLFEIADDMNEASESEASGGEVAA